MQRLTATVFCLLTLIARGQDSMEIKQAREGITKLYTEWNKARLKYDRSALEKLFADDYTWVHGFGYMDDKTAAINDQLSTDSIQALPIPDLVPLKVYGNAAVLKRLNKGPQGSSYNTNIFVRQGDKWVFAHSQTTLFQPEPKAIRLAPEKFRTYTGTYEREGRLLVIANKNDTLQVQTTRVPIRNLLPLDEERFFDKLGSEYRFAKNGQGQVTHFLLRTQNGQELQWKKIN